MDEVLGRAFSGCKFSRSLRKDWYSNPSTVFNQTLGMSKYHFSFEILPIGSNKSIISPTREWIINTALDATRCVQDLQLFRLRYTPCKQQTAPLGAI